MMSIFALSVASEKIPIILLVEPWFFNFIIVTS